MEEGHDLPAIRKSVTQEQIRGYAGVSGDTNPLHLAPDFAARGPFGRVVAHGMLVLAFLSEMLTQAFGRSWLETGRLRVRFRAPVYPGDEVITFGQITRVSVEDGQRRIQCQVGCRKQEGEEVITGEASLTMADR